MGKQSFKELVVWQKAKELAVSVYCITEKQPLARDFSLRDQIRRSAVSVPSNLAEGEERNTNKESIQFFYIAKGSLGELRTQLQIASEVGLLEQATYGELEKRCEVLARMIGRLIQARLSTSNLVPRTPQPLKREKNVI